jgi:hypothetical protein
VTLQPLTDDELPALPDPNLVYFDAALQSPIDGYTPSQFREGQRQAAEAQRLKSEGELAKIGEPVAAMLLLSGEVWDLTSSTHKWDQLVQDDPRYTKQLLYPLPPNAAARIAKLESRLAKAEAVIQQAKEALEWAWGDKYVDGIRAKHLGAAALTTINEWEQSK